MSLFTKSSPLLSNEHKIFEENIKKFFSKEMVPKIKLWEQKGVIEKKFWEKAGSFGIIGGSVPTIYGGSGGDLSYDSIVLYEQAKTGDFSWGYAIQSIVIHYLLKYGNENQKKKWIPRLISGKKIAALAMTEPETGSDFKSIKTFSKKEGNYYIINGSKTFITNGQSANLILLATKTNPNENSKGISLILIDTSKVNGFRRGKNLKKLGMKGNDTAELFFDNVKVPLNCLLGDEENKGFYQIMNQLSWERLAISITALGAIDHALEITIDYVSNRRAFKKRIMDFQNTRFKLAECKTKAEILRSFINDCILQINLGILDVSNASMAKFWGTQTQNEIMNECLQLYGGYGYMLEYPIAKMFSDARVQTIYGGTNEIMKELIARSLDKV